MLILGRIFCGKPASTFPENALGPFGGQRSIRTRCPVKPVVHSSAPDLLDYVVGSREQGLRHGEAQYPGGRLVDDQLELA